MKLFTHLGICTTVTVTLALLFSSFVGLWFGDEESVFDLGRALVLETHRTEALFHRMEMVSRAIDIKRAVAAEVLAGRLSLHEAALRFQDANSLIKNTDVELVAHYQLPKTEDGLCRQVIGWAQGESWILPPEQAQRILAGLEEEYKSLFGSLPLAEDIFQLAE